MSGSEYISFGGGLALQKPNEYGSNTTAMQLVGVSPHLLPQAKEKEPMALGLFWLSKPNLKRFKLETLYV